MIESPKLSTSGSVREGILISAEEGRGDSEGSGSVPEVSVGVVVVDVVVSVVPVPVPVPASAIIGPEVEEEWEGDD